MSSSQKYFCWEDQERAAQGGRGRGAGEPLQEGPAPPGGCSPSPADFPPTGVLPPMASQLAYLPTCKR